MKKRLNHLIKLLMRKLIGDPPVLLEEMPDSPALFRSYRMLIATGHKRVSGGWVYENEFYPDYLTAGGNTFAIRRTAMKYCKGKGLDIGAAFWPLPGSTPVDTAQGPGTMNRIEDVPLVSQDYVFSSHCLEHIKEWGKALDVWTDKLKPGGILFLYLPHPSCRLWHKDNPMMSETHQWVPTPKIITDALTARGLEIIDRDNGPDCFYSFFICAKRLDNSTQSDPAAA